MVFQGQNIVIGNVGDSRAVLATRDKDSSLIAIQLTVDLKPDLPGLSLSLSHVLTHAHTRTHILYLLRCCYPNSNQKKGSRIYKTTDQKHIYRT